MKKLVIAAMLCVLACNVYAQSPPRLAVVAFATNSERAEVKEVAGMARAVVESLMAASGKYQVISRDEIDKLLENQRIQASRISSDENITKLQRQNIRFIVTGSVNAVDGGYVVTVKILDVSTGAFPHSADGFMRARELGGGVSALVSAFIAGESGGKKYKIGDIGPAGGIVFYDKGALTDGWRYLEAAPAGSEFGAEWGVYVYDVAGANTWVGSGKRNTQLIVERLKQLGEGGRAAQLCAGFDINGYKDWFLPSRDELDLMYQNLARKGLGGFSGRFYWSSSQYGTSIAWVQRFSDGVQYYDHLNSTHSVRAARAF